MSNLNKILATNQKKPQKESVRYEVPTFTAGGGVKRKEKKRVKKGWLAVGISAGCVLCLLYIPGLFMQEESNPLIVQTEIANSTALKNTVLRDYPNADFDDDGIINADEVNVYNTNPWLMDTDADGASDLYEIKIANTDPITPNDLLSQIQKNEDYEKGENMETPYRNNNVLLWADSYYAKSHGGAIQTITGYHFNDFTGYAQFAESGYAYKYANGVHTLLEYREAENVWRIDGDGDVEIYTDRLVEYVEISLFGLKFHPKRNFFTEVVDFILPQKGFITARKITILDMEAKSGGVYANVQQIPFDINDGFRFLRNNTSLNDLAYVRSCIESDLCVLVSLYNTEIGEYIGIVYGYDYYGNLMIADRTNLSPVGKLYITEKAVRMINAEGQMESIGCYDFYGLGFDSANTRISFFATAVGKINDFEYLPQNQPEDEVQSNTEEPDTDNPQSEGSNMPGNTVSDNNLPEEILGETVSWDSITVIQEDGTVSTVNANSGNDGGSDSPEGSSGAGGGDSPEGFSGSGDTSNTETVSQNTSSTTTSTNTSIPATQPGQSYNPDTQGQSEVVPPAITGNSSEEDIIDVLEKLSE